MTIGDCLSYFLLIILRSYSPAIVPRIHQKLIQNPNPMFSTLYIRYKKLEEKVEYVIIYIEVAEET